MASICPDMAKALGIREHQDKVPRSSGSSGQATKEHLAIGMGYQGAPRHGDRVAGSKPGSIQPRGQGIREHPAIAAPGPGMVNICI